MISTTASRSARRSTSPSADAGRRLGSRRRDLFPASLQSREAWWSEWRKTSVPMKIPVRPLAQHRVPHRRGVAGCPASRCHGRGGIVALRRDAGVDQLPMRGDLTGVGVDEEESHGGRRIGRERRAPSVEHAWQEALALLRRRPAAPRRRRAHAARLRLRLRPVRAVVRRPAATSRPTSTTRVLRRYAAALGERDVVAAHGRAQARRAALALPRAARARPHRSKPRRPGAGAQARVQAAARPQGRRGRRAAGPHPGRRRRWTCATARCSSSPTPAACAPRSSSTSTLARSTSTPRRSASRARAARRASSRSASRRCRR